MHVAEERRWWSVRLKSQGLEWEGLSPSLQLLSAVVALAEHSLRAEDVTLVLNRAGLPSRDGVPWSLGAVRKALHQLEIEGFLEDAGHGDWTLAPLEKPRVLALVRARDPEGLRTLARKTAEDDLPRAWSLSGLLSCLVKASLADDPTLVARVWKRIEGQRRDPYQGRDGGLGIDAQNQVGVFLRQGLVTGVWASLARDQKLWLIDLRAHGAVVQGIPGRELPTALAAGEADPVVLSALADWEAVGRLVAGDFAEAKAAASESSETGRGVRILTAWLGGDSASALDQLKALLDDRAQVLGTKAEGFVPGPLFPLLACLALAHGLASASKLKSWASDHAPLVAEPAKILWAAFRHQGKADGAERFRDDAAKVSVVSLLDRLLMNWGSVWNGLGVGRMPVGPRTLAPLNLLVHQECFWYAAEEARTLERALENLGPVKGALEGARLPGLVRPFTDLIDAQSAWEVSLRRLAELKFDAPGAPAKASSPDQVAWLVDPQKAVVDPVLRKISRDGGWSTPRPAPLTKLGKGDHPAIQDDDRAALKALFQGYYGWEMDHKKALEALAGHPRLFLASDVDVPLTLEAVEVELKVEESASGLRFRFAVPLDSDRAQLVKIAADHWQVFITTDKVKKVAEVVGTGLTVPLAARDRVIEVLGSLASGIQIRSPLLKETREAVDVTSDDRPVVLLTPQGTGFGLEVHVRPLGPGTPLLRPGEGPVLVHARAPRGLLTATRDLKKEARSWKSLLARCPDLDAGLGGSWALTLDDPLDGLTLLAELRDAGDAVVVEWPKGGALRLHRRVGAGALKLQVGKDRQWFTVDGSVALDEDRVVAFRELLNAGTPSRFVRLADGDWVELEAQLVRQLQHLHAVGEATARHWKIAPLALAGSDLLLDETLTRAEADIDRWRRLWKAGVSPNLGLPASITADLRPYQIDGFRWLARLAEVGAGACLADDMGLGKTLQAIALLAHRASEGPSLVVAPTSVAPNWVAEIQKFDQSLEPVLFSEGSRAARQARVAGLGPGQVLLVTYGLLVTEGELLAGREWNTVVLDEAQAVKNFQAKRTKAVLELRAGFRLALTGTPLQNHLGELWTLFEFLNPGLLGAKTQFTERFWSPIEVKNDEGARRSLQTLVRPFLLRRTKNQVLTELPEKTETTLAVDLAPGEREFYEALRRQAVEQMAASGSKKAGEQQILILAHLMKLRRACCHPALAGGPEAPSSSKLDQLEELLESLIDNGHRTLVFSQFTDHLALIKTRLDARGWAYESLDGSTPAQDRGALVTRFQTGTAPVFLISLQAGGTGLNLTAADYVVHMDPWWNPAVEDQASDRAHRLGQTRPVTIYRLVARDTIEERIVALHRTKRDLADALLEGTEAVGRLGTEELLELMAGATPETPPPGLSGTT